MRRRREHGEDGEARTLPAGSTVAGRGEGGGSRRPGQHLPPHNPSSARRTPSRIRASRRTFAASRRAGDRMADRNLARTGNTPTVRADDTTRRRPAVVHKTGSAASGSGDQARTRGSSSRQVTQRGRGGGEPGARGCIGHPTLPRRPPPSSSPASKASASTPARDAVAGARAPEGVGGQCSPPPAGHEDRLGRRWSAAGEHTPHAGPAPSNADPRPDGIIPPKP